MAAIQRGIKGGYSICIVGDNSEPGFLPKEDVALVAAFDIPAGAINDDARQMRFSNESTSDDHAIHLVGWMEKNGHEWFLIKDSGNRAQNGRIPGYMFYRDDFVKLKMMNIMVHKDVLGETLSRFK
jgi:bleomycin hydrolase